VPPPIFAGALAPIFGADDGRFEARFGVDVAATLDFAPDFDGDFTPDFDDELTPGFDAGFNEGFEAGLDATFEAVFAPAAAVDFVAGFAAVSGARFVTPAVVFDCALALAFGFALALPLEPALEPAFEPVRALALTLRVVLATTC
jgi:hypothetical protein